MAEMKTRVLGRTGLNVSVIGVGTWQFGGEWGRSYTAADTREILAAALDCGINLIDTAECYGDHLSERLIGETLPGRRADWIIATKWGHKFHECFKRDPRVGPADLLEQLDASLQALRTDYVNLLQFHSANDVREVWMKAKQDRMLREAGQIAAHEVPVGVPMAQWALAWVLRNPAVTAVIPGCKDAAQVRANAAAALL